MPLIQRYTNTVRGAMILTGNALNCMRSGVFPPGFDFQNGSYISTNTSLVAGAGFPPGTTTTFPQSSSSAIVDMPSGSTVLFAQLFWIINGTGFPNPDVPITFTTPIGTNSVSPNLSLRQTFSNFVVWQAQDVASLVQAGGSGTYTVGAVPGITAINNNTFVGNGWGLIIVYQNPSLPTRYFNINTGVSFVQNTAPSDFNFTGFVTPATGIVKAYFLASETNGDLADAAQIFIGTTQPTSTQIGNTSTGGVWNGLAPFAPQNNMLPGNILIADTNNPNIGLLDTRGTFGTFNKNPFAVTAGPFSRINMDILGVDISNKLTNNQTSLFTRVTYSGSGSGQVTSQSVQVDINQANFVPLLKTVDKNYIDIGDTVTYTIVFTNNGLANANNIVLTDTVPSSLTFVGGSLTIDGVTVPSANPNPPGISIGTMVGGQTKTVTFKATATTISSPNPAINSAQLNYSFITTGTNVQNDVVFSNNTVTTISNATISATKIVSKNYADVGDILTYTIPLNNTGNVSANNVFFIDTIPNDTTLIPNSFKQDNTVISQSPNPPGITLPNSIGPRTISTITFQVRVDTIPSPNPITNTATTRYTYTVNPSIPNATSRNTSTNIVTTTINNANLSNILKGVDKSYGKIGDIITYTITIPNVGNATADNVVFRDTIPNGTSFIPNSVIINGTQQNGLLVAPPDGLSLGTIGPNSTVTISFRVTVTTIPSPNPIPNSANVIYSYIQDTNLGTTISGSNNTNIVSTTINSAVINSTKSVTPTNTTVGETIFYTIILTNSGNATANNVVFIDTIPNDTTLVLNSLTVNGTTISGSPNPPGINLSNIAPGGRTTITFSVTVDTIPTPNPIPNSSYTNYNFVLNPTTGETSPNTSLSNTVSTFVNPDSNPLKTADKQYAKPGDIITYIVQWQNRLNTTATDVTFLDTIPNDTSFIPNSFTINGVTIPGADPSPPTGVNVGTIPSQVYTTVTFQVRVNTIPNPNPIPNQAYGRYSYISDPTLGTVTTETGVSNIVTTKVNYASIPSATKVVDKSFAKVGDILTYTISFTNTGNTTATNVKLIDTIPSGTSFNINSVFVNGSNQPGAVVAAPTGLNLGDLAVNSTTTIVFSITVNTIPNPNPIPNSANIGYNYIVDPIISSSASDGVNTNIANTTINYANLGIIGKTVDKSFANVGDTLLYIITIRNTGNVTANNLILVDTIPNDTSFITSSVLINGVLTSTVPTGNIFRVNMGNISTNAVTSLAFKVKIDSIPNPNPIPNSANASYTYTLDPSIPNGESVSNNTNTVNTQVNNANLTNTMKFVDKIYTICGDIITYTISIPNNGNITAINVILSDTVPNGTVLVANSILVNGVQSTATSPISIPIGSINPGSTTTVSFKVIVNC